MPMIAVGNRQRAVKIDLEALQKFAERALDESLKISRGKPGVLAQLSRVDVILVSDRRMSGMHRQFMNVSGPTDVITFQHGEIFISAETARENARRFRKNLEAELCLYVAHGLLHLCGFDDKNARDAKEMEAAQKKVVAASQRLNAGRRMVACTS